MAKVFIGCKLPNGLLMELIRLPENKNSIIPVGRTDDDIVVRLAGANESRIARTNPADAAFGITEVDEEFAKEWFKRNKGLKFVKDGLVFMVGTDAAAKAEAKDRRTERTGLEPLNPDPAKDSRVQAGIEPDKKHLALMGVTA